MLWGEVFSSGTHLKAVDIIIKSEEPANRMLCMWVKLQNAAKTPCEAIYSSNRWVVQQIMSSRMAMIALPCNKHFIW